MKKAIVLLMLLLWVIVTSSSQNKPVERIERAPLVKSLDSLNSSLNKLKLALDERD
ncbi:hypothetical protein SAMN05421877_11940 [Sphingobacterium lactis]|uniref:Uncharacterized protein n=1 Tax=Sphingobacterium lactis TaxID=797291 RepID=A0A1H6CRW3_9SPHI|nr:hypothetical protein SAMN05421877_11940 [Sphingobacterium lactis]